LNEFMTAGNLQYEPISAEEKAELGEDLLKGTGRGVSGHKIAYEDFFKVRLQLLVVFHNLFSSAIIFSFLSPFCRGYIPNGSNQSKELCYIFYTQRYPLNIPLINI